MAIWQNGDMNDAMSSLTTKTTLRIDKETKRNAQELARKRNQTLQHVLNEALRHYISSQSKNQRVHKIRLITKPMGKQKAALTRENIYSTDENITR